MNFLKAITPFGLTNINKGSIKRFFRGFIPAGLVQIVHNRNLKKRYTSQFLRKYYVSDLTDREKWSILAYLKLLENKQKAVNYLEVGIYAGGTIKFLLENTQSAQFTGVDLFDDFIPTNDNTHMWQNYTMEVIEEAINSKRLKLWKGNSVEVLKQLSGEGNKFDIIFIDGNHTYQATLDDFNASETMLKSGGYVCFHNCSPGMTQEDKDYLMRDGGPWMVTQELKEKVNYRLEVEIDRIRIFQKI